MGSEQVLENILWQSWKCARFFCQ